MFKYECLNKLFKQTMGEIRNSASVNSKKKKKNTNAKNVTDFIMAEADVDIYTNCSTVRIQNGWHGCLMNL